MSINCINRQNDEEIIDIVRSVLDNGTGKAETANEHILIKLMQLRGTPITSFTYDQKRVEFHYLQWKREHNPPVHSDGAKAGGSLEDMPPEFNKTVDKHFFDLA